MVTLTKSQALTTLIWVRFILGAISWFLPKVMTKVMLIDGKANPALPYGLRLFGARDVHERFSGVRFAQARLELGRGRGRLRVARGKKPARDGK